MTENPGPTRGEASEGPNAFFDGSDAEMRSAETATGRYPVESVKMMDRIVREAEGSITEYLRPHRRALLSLAGTAPEPIFHGSPQARLEMIPLFTVSASAAPLVLKDPPPPPCIR